MEKKLAFNPEKWFYDPPINQNFGRGKLASPYMQKVVEDIALKALGQDGLKKLQASD
jgi:hypothetical protein